MEVSIELPIMTSVRGGRGYLTVGAVRVMDDIASSRSGKCPGHVAASTEIVEGRVYRMMSALLAEKLISLEPLDRNEALSTLLHDKQREADALEDDEARASQWLSLMQQLNATPEMQPYVLKITRKGVKALEEHPDRPFLHYDLNL